MKMYREHLYKTHKQQIHCSTCYQTFPTGTSKYEHESKPEKCKPAARKFFDGFNSEQERQMRCRKRTKISEEEKWRVIYKILFPQVAENAIPSPCKQALAMRRVKRRCNG